MATMTPRRPSQEAIGQRDRGPVGDDAPGRAQTAPGQRVIVPPGALKVTWILMAVAFVVGLIARLQGLGGRPLAVDEYYFLVSVESILRGGVPEPPGGGYYVRGLPLQYLTALSVALFGGPELGLRVPTMLLGLLVPLVAYFYGKRVHGAEVGVALAVALLVSSWAVEFSLFGRMYTAFQLLTLLFLITLHAVIEGGARGARLFLPHLWGGLAFLTHSLGIFLIPLLALPIILPQARRRLGTVRHQLAYAGVTAAVGLATGVYFRTTFRRMGVEARFPAPGPDGTLGLAEGNQLLRLPGFPFWNIGGSQHISLATVLALLVAIGLFHLCLRFMGRRPGGEVTVAAMALVAAIFHQLLLSAGMVLFVLGRYRIHQEPRRFPVPLAMLGGTALIGAAWVTFAAFLTFGLGSRAWLEAAASPTFRSGVSTILLGWPQVADSIARPWFREMPVLATLLAGGIVYQLLSNLRKPLHKLVLNPAIVLLYVAVVFGTFDSLYDRTRYTYFVYPVALAALFLTIGDLIRRIRMRTNIPATSAAAGVWVVAAGLGVFVLTEDFDPGHLARTGTPEVSFRLGAYEQRAATWYSRQDVLSPARFVAAHSAQDDAVVVINVPPASYYLERDHAVYLDRSDDRFRHVAREAGTVDYWSGQRLLSTPEELGEHVLGRSRVWIIQRAGDPRHPDRHAYLTTRPHHAERMLLSRDDRVETILMHFLPESQR
jgi:hypothetical protein